MSFSRFAARFLFIAMTSLLTAMIPVMAAPPSATCSTNLPETQPAPVELKKVFSDVLALKDTQGRLLITQMTPSLDSALRVLFEADPKSISKLEQFFGLLYAIAQSKNVPDRKIEFDVAPVKKLLLSSRVFSTPDLPNHLQSVVLYWSSYAKKATYEVRFDQKDLELPLNAGKGFANFSEGMCQIAQKLIFYGGFNFDIERTRRKANVYVSNFKNLDLFGKFGSRGTVNVDIQYVTIKSVEFISGSPMGTVRAKVSDREFQVNEHSFLLKMVAKLVTDKSTQPIDW